MKYSLCNVKVGIGHDRGGVQADIKRGNQKVAFVSDDGWGGPMNMDWLIVDEAGRTKYTNEIKSFCEKIAREKNEVDFLEFLKNDQQGDEGLWVYLFEYLLELWQDAQEAKSMKPSKDQVVWLITEKNPSPIQAGESFLLMTSKIHVTKDIKQRYEDKGKKVASVKKLSLDNFIEI